MATVIRLRREGSKDRPYYRIVVTDSRSPRDGRFIEGVGTYDPLKKDDSNHMVDLERIDHWLSTGAKPSDTVRSLIKRARKSAAAAG